MERTILHVDMNNFFASVELLSHPELRDKPVAVSGDVESRHGIILAKNYVARNFGIQTGEVIWKAKQLCPELVLLPPHYDLYVQISSYARQIYENYTDLVEPFGIDEAWLDVSGSMRLFNSGEAVAKEILMRIKKEIGITASAGISWNKVFAKLGSDMKKPDAYTEITQNNYRTNVWELPLGALLNVGPASRRMFARYGIDTIGHLANCECGSVEKIAGKNGVSLWYSANGLDNSPVLPSYARPIVKSIGNSMTTPRDLCNCDDVRMVFLALAEHVGTRARAQNLKGATLSIHVRESSSRLRTYERQCALRRPTNITKELADTAQQLFDASYQWLVPVRSIGLRLSDLRNDNLPEQLTLFSDERKRVKLERLDRVMDSVQSKYGAKGLRHGTVFCEDWSRDIGAQPRDILH